MVFRRWFGRIRSRGYFVIRYRLPGLPWLAGGGVVVSMVVRYKMGFAWWTQVRSRGAGLSGSIPLEVSRATLWRLSRVFLTHTTCLSAGFKLVVSLPDPRDLAALDCEFCLLPTKNPCCSVVNLPSQPLISVGSTGSVDAYYD